MSAIGRDSANADVPHCAYCVAGKVTLRPPPPRRSPNPEAVSQPTSIYGVRSMKRCSLLSALLVALPAVAGGQGPPCGRGVHEDGEGLPPLRLMLGLNERAVERVSRSADASNQRQF